MVLEREDPNVPKKLDFRIHKLVLVGRNQPLQSRQQLPKGADPVHPGARRCVVEVGDIISSGLSVAFGVAA